jgi:hypothetical protein
VQVISEYVTVEEDTEQLVKLEEGKSICYFYSNTFFVLPFALLNCCPIFLFCRARWSEHLFIQGQGKRKHTWHLRAETCWLLQCYMPTPETILFMLLFA